MITLLDIVLLGTGGGMPIPERYLSSLVINYRGRKILIDCGEGTQIAMRKEHTGFKSTDIICITHFHGDHILGLPGLLLTIGNSDRKLPITIIGPPGIGEIMEGLKVVIPYLPFDLNIIEIAEGELAFNISDESLILNEEENTLDEGITISTIEVDHCDPCIGYGFYIPRRPEFEPQKARLNRVPRDIWQILQGGQSIKYKDKDYDPSMVLGEERKGIKFSFITDTRPTDKIREFIKESQLFVCEETYGDNEDLEKAMENKHMTFAEAANLAKKARVDKLLLTHFSPSVEDPQIYKDNALDIFAPTIIGYDGYRATLSYKE